MKKEKKIQLKEKDAQPSCMMLADLFTVSQCLLVQQGVAEERTSPKLPQGHPTEKPEKKGQVLACEQL